MPVDSTHSSFKGWRVGRSGLNNIIPKNLLSYDTIETLFGLEGKLKGVAMRVPTMNVASIDITFTTDKPATYDELMAKMKERASGDLKEVLEVTDQQVVSTDLKGVEASCIVDSLGGHSITPHFHKVMGWYDNEWGYATRVSDMACYVAKVDGNLK